MKLKKFLTKESVISTIHIENEEEQKKTITASNSKLYY